MSTLRIATRQSPLALWQANFIKGELERAHPGLEVSLVTMRTQGDRWLNQPLSEVGGKGLFIKELEQAMLDGRADASVHSMKDLPAELPPGFALPVIGFRDDVRDLLVGADSVDALPQGARVGSSSLRRQSQLLAHRPDLQMLPIRGNVGTRLDKLAAGEFDAIVLAAAGLKRLGIQPQPSAVLEPELSLPAAGQAALGVETLADAEAVQAMLAPLADAGTAALVHAERGVSAGLGADCSMPLAAHAVWDKDHHIHLKARLLSADGRTVLEAEARQAEAQPASDAVVAALKRDGAEDILAALR